MEHVEHMKCLINCDITSYFQLEENFVINQVNYKMINLSEVKTDTGSQSASKIKEFQNKVHNLISRLL